MREPVRGLIERRIEAFRSDPASPLQATRVIIVVTVVTVLAASLVMWLVGAEKDFPDYGTALWFALQTVTTVGYGDVTPETGVGRLVAGVVMVVAIAFMAIVTAIVTSTFVDAAQSRRRRDDNTARVDADHRLEERLDEITRRLAAIEERLDESGRPGPDA